MVEEVCSRMKGADFLGLFNPLNESWQWAFFVEVEGLEDWETISDEISTRSVERVDDFTAHITRFYSRIDHNPKPRNQRPLRLINVELDVWDGINVGIKEYHDAHVRTFEGQKDVWYMGQYSPANEDYTWAHFYWFDSWKRANEMSIASFRSISRPERLRILCTRNYRRYEPKV